MTRDTDETARDPRAVFVVYGRHEAASSAVLAFLVSIGLEPLEWHHLVRLTGKGSPYVGEVLDAGFRRATAAVVLFTPDDEARLRTRFRSVNEPVYETSLTGQARPNVILEAGMALGVAPDRTILVEFGALRPISDLTGRHVIRINNTELRRRELAERLETAGCRIDLSGDGWKTAGDFDAAIRDLSIADDDGAALPIDLEPGYSVETSHDRGGVGQDQYEIAFPQIQGLSDSYIQRRLNGVLEQEFKKLGGVLDDQGQPRQSYYSTEDDPPTSTWIVFEVGLTTTSLISLRADQSVDIGGIHPTNGSTGFVVELSSGYRYSLNDLFRSDQDYIGILRAHIRSALQRDFLDDPTWNGAPPEPDAGTPGPYDFYFTKRELVIINLFTAHALQAVWARIPFSDLVNAADPLGPLNRILTSRTVVGAPRTGS